MSVVEFLRKHGATNPSTALTTEFISRRIGGNPNRIVYQELFLDPNIQRIDVETNNGTPDNGWYIR